MAYSLNKPKKYLLFNGPPRQKILCVIIVGLFLLTSPWPSNFLKSQAFADEITDHRHQIQSLEERLKALHQDENRLHDQEKQLSERIRRLKEESRKGQGLLLEMRIEASLRDLRDLLLSIKRVEAQEQEIEKQLSARKALLRGALSQRINDQMKAAQELYRKGREKDADQVYLEGLSLMEEYKKLSEIQIEEETALSLPHVLEIPPLSQAEPEQLKELADLMMADAELLNTEVARYTEIQERLYQEKRLLDQIVGFQGVIERGPPSSSPKRHEVDLSRRALDKKILLVQEKITFYSERVRTLNERARQLLQIAEDKNAGP